MVANGMRDAGYVYVNLDDGWQRYKGSRREHPLEVDPAKFPARHRVPRDYAHGKGMKLGIYSGPARRPARATRAARATSAGRAMFASWGIDHLKYDSCCSHPRRATDRAADDLRTMSNALMAQKRGIVLHACHCGWGNIWEWAAALGVNHWRIGQDISTTSTTPATASSTTSTCSTSSTAASVSRKYAGPGTGTITTC
jgi:alpha-galactosidase